MRGICLLMDVVQYSTGNSDGTDVSGDSTFYPLAFSLILKYGIYDSWISSLKPSTDVEMIQSSRMLHSKTFCLSWSPI